MVARAVELSKKCDTLTYPNPKVGAVIFDDNGKIVAEGFTACYGGDHAEIEALKKINFKGELLNMAVSLEPCNHFGKTPPCSHAILNAGIKKVFIAKKEENGSACNGTCFLEENGVEVEFLEQFSKEVEEINKFFFKNIRTSLPWVTVKVARSSDQFITAKKGEPTKITGEKSQIYVHQLRAEHMAIAVGAGTVNSDNPELTVRKVKGISPQTLIFSRNMSVNPKASLFKRVPIVITKTDDKSKAALLIKEGGKVEFFDEKALIKDVLRTIYEKYKLNSILVEGGAQLIEELLFEQAVDEFQMLTSPKKLNCGIKLFSEKSFAEFSNQFILQSETFLEKDLLQIYRKK